MKLLRVVLASAAVLAVGLALWTTGISAQPGKLPDNEYAADVQKIAELLEKGKDADAKKVAKDLAKKLDGDVHDVMALMRPRKTKGFGVGPDPDKIQPDGIENKLKAIGRDGITQGVLDKEAAALKEMGYRMAAIAEIGHATGWPKDMGKKTKKAWNKMIIEMRGQVGEEFAKAIDSKSPATVKAAVTKLQTNCNNCHSEFR